MNNNTFNLFLLHPPLSLVTTHFNWFCTELDVYCFHPVLLEALSQAVFLTVATSCSCSDMITWRDVRSSGKNLPRQERSTLWRSTAPSTGDGKCEPKINIWLSLSIHAGNPPQLPKSSHTQVHNVDWAWCYHVGKHRHQWHWGELIQKN